STDSISPSLAQRISMVRALAARPRLVLFDNADRSLDRDGYAALYSLLARLKGKVSMILVSDDMNIRALADRVYALEDGGLHPVPTASGAHNIHPYKELRL